MDSLKRNFVFGRGRRGRRAAGALAAASGRRTGRRVAIVAAAVVILVLVLATAASAALAADHLHPLANHAQLGTLLAVFFPLLELQPAFDQDRRALAQVFARDLGRATPHRHVHERRLFDPLTGLVLAAVVDGEAHVGHGHPALQIPDFDVASQVPEQDYAVETGHRSPRWRRLQTVNKRYTEG